MKKNIALISIFAVLMIAFSGCVGNNNSTANSTGSDNPKTSSISGQNVSEISKIKNLPAGFEYVGSPSLSVDDIKTTYRASNVSGILGGSEGLYKGSNNTDFVVDVIQLENKEAASNFISAYKSSFTPLNNVSRFEEESINGHSVIRIADFTFEAEKTVPRYIYIWNNENYVLVVSGSTSDMSLVRKLAEATGY
jgi:hypothetical protein